MGHEADGAGVEPPSRRLELGDELHRPNLGRAGDAAARGGGEGQRLPGRPRAERREHRGDAVVQRRQRHDPRGRRDAHAPRRRHAPEIVPLEIDDHGELGALLRIGLERARERGVLVRVSAAGSRALDGLGAHGPVGRRAQEELRRGRQHRGFTVESQVTSVSCAGRAQETRKEHLRVAVLLNPLSFNFSFLNLPDQF